jgi:hypothetical protein
MVKPFPNMNKDSNMTLRWCLDGGKLLHKRGISLAGIYVISKQSAILIDGFTYANFKVLPIKFNHIFDFTFPLQTIV